MAADHMVEIWQTGMNGGSGPVPANTNNQFAELNANLARRAKSHSAHSAPSVVALWVLPFWSVRGFVTTMRKLRRCRDTISSRFLTSANHPCIAPTAVAV